MRTNSNWIQTYSGGKFWPLDPSPKEVNIVDIAWALSMQCRYTGHSSKFYSVGDHSCWVSDMVPDEYKFQALMHDAAEAYLIDVARPVKHADGFLFYREAEEKISAAIGQRYGIDLVNLPHEVHHADSAMLITEAHHLFPYGHPAQWRVTCSCGNMKPYENIIFKPRKQIDAYRDFIGRFYMLQEKHLSALRAVRGGLL